MARLGLDGARATELVEVGSAAGKCARSESELGRRSARDLLEEPGIPVWIGELRA